MLDAAPEFLNPNVLRVGGVLRSHGTGGCLDQMQEGPAESVAVIWPESRDKCHGLLVGRWTLDPIQEVSRTVDGFRRLILVGQRTLG